MSLYGMLQFHVFLALLLLWLRCCAGSSGTRIVTSTPLDCCRALVRVPEKRWCGSLTSFTVPFELHALLQLQAFQGAPPQLPTSSPWHFQASQVCHSSAAAAAM